MLQEQSANVAYFMTNSEPLIDFAGPTTSRVIPIGGITAMEPLPLNEAAFVVRLFDKYQF